LLVLSLGSRWADRVLGIAARILSRLRLTSHLGDRITNMARVFLRGTSGALALRTLLYALLCSMFVWGANAASVAIICGAVIGHVPPIPVVLLGFAIFSIGLAIPLTPAYVGQYEALWVLVFTNLHVAAKDDVLAAGVLCHSLILLMIALLGIL